MANGPEEKGNCEYGRVARTLAADGGAGGAGGDGAAVGHSTTCANQGGGGCNGRHLLRCIVSLLFFTLGSAGSPIARVTTRDENEHGIVEMRQTNNSKRDTASSGARARPFLLSSTRRVH